MTHTQPLGTAAGLDVVVQDLKKSYTQVRGRSAWAIEGLSFELQAGEKAAVVGPTGCGKSTLFNILCGLTNPTSGQVRIGGRSPSQDFDWFRGKIGIVFQEDRLLPWRTAIENVELGLEMVGLDSTERRYLATQRLTDLSLADSLDCYPGELSGGMRQRVALARALVLRPRLILADEAFGRLDEVTAKKLRQDFLAEATRNGSTVILITHQLEEAIEVGGRILAIGKPGRLLADLNTDRELSRATRSHLRRRIREMLKA